MNLWTNPYFDSQINHFKVEIYNAGYAELESTWECGDVIGLLSRLYYIESGEAEITSEGATIIAKPGYVYFIPAEIAWHLKCRSQLRKFFVDFNLLNPNGDMFFMENNSVIEFPFPVEKIQNMIKWYLGEHIEEMFFLKTALYQTISDALQTSNIRHTPPVYSPLILNTIKYIMKNLSLELTVGTLAEQHFVSKTFLSTQFKKEVGMSIGQYIDSQIILRARIELEQHKLSIAEISNKFGFCDQFYFSRFFKKHIGESPLQYRNQHASLSYYSAPAKNKS